MEVTRIRLRVAGVGAGCAVVEGVAEATRAEMAAGEAALVVAAAVSVAAAAVSVVAAAVSDVAAASPVHRIVAHSGGPPVPARLLHLRQRQVSHRRNAGMTRRPLLLQQQQQQQHRNLLP